MGAMVESLKLCAGTHRMMDSKALFQSPPLCSVSNGLQADDRDISANRHHHVRVVHRVASCVSCMEGNQFLKVD